jgi:hypothetical protein
MIKCLSTMRQIGFGLKMYSSDNRDTFPAGDSLQLDPYAPANAPYFHCGNALGGTDPRPDFRPLYPMATNRLLATYVPAREAWRCPADRGLDQPKIKPSSYEVVGASYRFNWRLDPPAYQSLRIAADPAYNLAGKKESWASEPSRFVMMHEAATYPWSENGIAQWHYSANPGKMFRPAELKSDRDKLVAPILFVDGHSQQCDFTRTFKESSSLMLEPGRDFIWYEPAD